MILNPKTPLPFSIKLIIRAEQQSTRGANRNRNDKWIVTRMVMIEKGFSTVRNAASQKLRKQEELMKIKVEGADMSVILTVDYRSWTLADDSWTASPKGIIGANKGHWVRADSLGGGYPVLFYGTGLGDEILMFSDVTRSSSGNPFKRWQTGDGIHLSSGGTMMTWATIEWKVLSI